MKPRVLITTPLIALILIYQRTLPNLYFWPRCRFEPSCSNYCIQALQQRKFLVALALSAWRILRCNPWCGGHGHDPVPERGWRRRNPAPGA